jgi:hypothetical protein
MHRILFFCWICCWQHAQFATKSSWYIYEIKKLSHFLRNVLLIHSDDKSFLINFFFGRHGVFRKALFFYLCEKQKMAFFKVEIEKKWFSMTSFEYKKIRKYNIEMSRTFEKFNDIKYDFFFNFINRKWCRHNWRSNMYSSIFDFSSRDHLLWFIFWIKN